VAGRLWRLGLHIARLLALSGGLLLFAQAFLPRHLTDPPCQMHQQLCAELDWAMQGGQRLIGALPREHAKTTLGTVALVLREVVLGGRGAWQQAPVPADSAGRQAGAPVATRRPKKNILIIGANAREARVKLRQIVTELESNPLLRAGFGKLCAPARDTKGHLVAYTDGEIVLAGGTRISTLGFGGKVRGQLSGASRLDLIILDDPEDDRSVANPVLRQQLRRWVDTALLNALDVRTGSLIWLGTLLHHDSVLAQLLDERGELPGHGLRDTRYGEKEENDPPSGWGDPTSSPLTVNREPYSNSTWHSLRLSALDDNNLPLWPGRWSYEALQQRRAEIGSRAFAQEYLNQPQSLEERIFLDEHWQLYNPALLAQSEGVWELDGRPLRTVIGVDPAIGEERQHDFFAAAVIGIREPLAAQGLPRACVLEVLHHKQPFAQQLQTLTALAEKWLPSVVGIESIAYQAALKQSAFELGLPAVELKGAKAKAARIETLAALVEAGRVALPAHGPWVARLREEACQYPSGKHDDQLDALARALEAAALLPGGGEAFSAEGRRGKPKGF
jgi:predicted phage terminase large subunit-like protein